MAGREFDVTTRPEDYRLTLELHGDINSAAGSKMAGTHALFDEPGLQSIVLDFEDVDYINSTGIALIVGLLARARAANLGVVAYGLNDHYRQIFQITRLADFVKIFPDREAAMGASHS